MPLLRHFARALTICSLCCAPALSAAAEPQPASPGDTADSLFREGRKAADAGDFETACEKFAKSLALERLAGTVFNLAYCEDKLGRVASALRHYREAVARMKTDDKRVGFARERAVALEPRLPRLTIHVEEPQPVGLQITCDGDVIQEADLGAAQPVDPGAHRIRVTADGHEPSDYDVTVEEAESRELRVEAGPALSTAPLLAPTIVPDVLLPLSDQRAAMQQRATGWALIGLSGAGVVLGAVAGGMVFREKGIFDTHCPGAGCRDQEGMDAANRGIAWGTTADVAFATGAVAAAVGLIVLLSPASPDITSSRASVRRELLLGKITW